MAKPEKYGKLTIGIHWLSALLILSMIPMGMVMTRLADSPMKTTMYRAHSVAGMVVLLLTIARIALFFVEKRPGELPGLTETRQMVFNGVHAFLYLILLVLVMTGIGMLLTAGVGLSVGSLTPDMVDYRLQPAQVHNAMSKAYIVLLILHIGGVVQYQRSKGDSLARMGFAGFLRKAD